MYITRDELLMQNIALKRKIAEQDAELRRYRAASSVILVPKVLRYFPGFGKTRELIGKVNAEFCVQFGKITVINEIDKIFR